MYRVTNIVGTSPQSVASTALFDTLGDAEAYAGTQYSAQTTSFPSQPFYPLSWWTVDEVNLQTQYESIDGYPASTSEALPGIPTGVTAATDGTSFTVSWVPNSPASPEFYIIGLNSPLHEGAFGVGGTTITNLNINTFDIPDYIMTPIGATAITFPGSPWGQGSPPSSLGGWDEINPGNGFNYYDNSAPFATDMNFNVAAWNAYGQGDLSTFATSVIAYGGSTPVPAAPADLSMTKTGTVGSNHVYDFSWSQSYPSGAGVPTSWTVLVPTSPFAHSITASGTPSTGSYSFTVASVNVEDFAVFAVNANGCSSYGYNNMTNPG